MSYYKKILGKRNFVSLSTLSLTVSLAMTIVSVFFGQAHAGRSDPMLLFIPAMISKGCTAYSIEKLTNSSGQVENKFMCDKHHFMTLIDDNGTMILRPHPGVDVNGWGSSWYAQPFLPGADLQHTTVQILEAHQGKEIHLAASGNISRGASSTYGTWNMAMDFKYYKTAKKITGTGTYSINLVGSLSNDSGDLNLYKIAGNYLDDVPLLSGQTGDTGDMKWVEVAHGAGQTPFSFSPWMPPNNPSFFPTDETNHLTVDVIGQCNNVDTAAQGYDAIKPAFKPSMKVVLAAQQSNTGIRFGAMYDEDKKKDFSADNVGITPIIFQSSTTTAFTFDVRFESVALPGDGTTPCP